MTGLDPRRIARQDDFISINATTEVDVRVDAGNEIDGRAALLKGGDNGPSVVPGDPEKSLLIQAVRHAEADLKMPKEKLDEEVRKYADELLSLSPTCLRIVKRSFYHHMQPIMGRDMNDLIAEVAPNYFSTGEQQEGASAFLEKRKPDFSRFS